MGKSKLKVGRYEAKKKERKEPKEIKKILYIL